jgi:hypothetical protein
MESNQIGFVPALSGLEENELANLKKRTQQYHQILHNTEAYRSVWSNELKNLISESLRHMGTYADLKGEIVVHNKMENLEAVQFTLGSALSGMKEEVSKHVHRTLIKHNGSLVYQQLFNGKIMVVINFPYIEGYGQPQPPKTLAIYRPEEIKAPYLIRHMEEFVQTIANWEDFDDDEPREANQAIGFKLNFDADKSIQTNG